MTIKDIKLNQWYDVSSVSELTGWPGDDNINYIKITEICQGKDWTSDKPVNLVCLQLLYIPGDENTKAYIHMGEVVLYNIELKDIDKLLSKPVDYPSFMYCLTQFCEDNDIRQPYDEIVEKGWSLLNTK